MQHPEGCLVVSLVAEDGGGHDEEGGVAGVDISGSGNELLFELRRDSIAVFHVLKVVCESLKFTGILSLQNKIGTNPRKRLIATTHDFTVFAVKLGRFVVNAFFLFVTNTQSVKSYHTFWSHTTHVVRAKN